jgi:hypothetical protein
MFSPTSSLVDATSFDSASESIESLVTPEPHPLLQHAADYGWLQGTLEYVHADSGRWKLRYAPLEADDRFGGSVMLTPDVCTNQFSEGDVVYVEGEIVQSRAGIQATRPLYRVHTIRAIQTGQ